MCFATQSSEAEVKKESTKHDNSPQDYRWMVKPCEVYKKEYRDCKSWKDRFHQYWVEGKLRDCDQWNKDYINCLEWQEKAQPEVLAELVQSEKIRIRSRLKAHYANDVWKERDSPPADWAKELPEHITKGYEGSFLQMKAKEIKEGTLRPEGEFVFTGPRCVIL